MIGVFLLGDLVDLIHKDNPPLCLLDVVVRRGEKLGYETLDIIPDIPSLCKRRSVCNGKRHIEKSRQGLDQISFTGACRAKHKDIGLFDLYIVHCIRHHPLVMVINRNGDDLLRLFLPDHIIVKLCLDLVRSRNITKIQLRRLILFFLFFFLLNLLLLWHHILQILHI